PLSARPLVPTRCDPDQRTAPARSPGRYRHVSRTLLAGVRRARWKPCDTDRGDRCGPGALRLAGQRTGAAECLGVLGGSQPEARRRAADRVGPAVRRAPIYRGVAARGRATDV